MSFWTLVSISMVEKLPLSLVDRVGEDPARLLDLRPQGVELGVGERRT